MKYLSYLGLMLIAMLLLPVTALADSAPPPQHTLALASTQVWVLAVGALVPIVTYVLNHVAPWTSEPVKAFVLVVAAAVAGGVTQAINAGNVGFNDSTFQLVLTSIIAALAAHGFLWKPSGVSTRLGGGSNA